MATDAHCLFCFETLAARLENRKSMTLDEVQKSWAEFKRATASTDSASKKTAPALRRIADTDSSGSSASSSTASLSGQAPANAADTPMTSVSSLQSNAPATPAESPLFVTWNVLSSRHEPALRGCIGTFEDQPLAVGLSSYAVTSALHDTRFDPISLRELPTLEVAVTLLTDFEDADDEMDWELGKHGLRISFTYHGRRKGATYLPQVAPEQGWTKEETIVSLMRKAGWLGQKDRWREVPLKVVRYQGEARHMPYADFKRWRTWVDDQA